MPVATEPVKAMQSTRSSAQRAAPTSPAPASRLTTPAGRCVEAAGAASRVESGVSSEGLATTRVARRERRRDLPGEQQQRVVPGDDAADDPERVLDDHRQLARLDRRDHPAGAGRGRSRRSSRRRPRVHSISSRFSTSGLPPSAVIVRASSLGVLAQPPGDLVEHLAALAAPASRPAARTPPGPPRPRPSTCSGGGRADRRDRLGRVAGSRPRADRRRRRRARRRSGAAGRSRGRAGARDRVATRGERVQAGLVGVVGSDLGQLLGPALLPGHEDASPER